ncbi:Winged helix-turn-helix DNA-binding domain-containing protein [Stemphylium lycopersici]|uniref:S-adenosyl-L-methionine-dependent methyltransferase n=1 Tax=Stemphylium lycopersici TaxID=183478 RepID=A0A364MYF8_STELY|nr:Winged helix-turn-helix DNA-binding domain-containing protein [Stemphylium lycopersici]RAR07145.1 S-adenosyl-L-methionine-dependent methyltransferase [Stemphylium lycopersici]
MTAQPSTLLSLVQEIANIGDTFKTANGYASQETRSRLIDSAERLAIAARYPDENVFFAVTRTTQNASIRIACALNIFAVVPSNDLRAEAPPASISVTNIASAINADPVVVARIMRALASCHIFIESGEDEYAHNDLSRAFLVPETLSMFSEIYDMAGKAAYALPEFLSKTGYKNPEDYNNSAFHLGAHTDLGFWEYLEADEKKLQAFNNGMRSQATVKDFDSSYPFEAELNASPLGQEDVVLVDVGGGRGHALERIKQRFPGLKGKLVLQDQAAVIKDAVAGGLSSEIEAQSASFFEPNPVKNARAYFFRRVLHDWSDAVCRTILQNTAISMGPDSRVLIAEYEVPATGAVAKLTMQDINMMGIGGCERTEKMWAKLLHSAGLELSKMWRTPGSNFVVVEGRLKEA